LGLLAFALVFQTSIARADSTPFSQIVVFGDSMSDPGNFYAMTGDTFPPSPPYYQGRFCNGPVWIEYLAEDLGMSGLVDNYAVGGAATGTGNLFGLPFGGVQNQIELYLSSHQCDPEALYVLWEGHNDVFLALATGSYDLSQVVPNIVNHIQTLWAAGARHLMVMNLAGPPLPVVADINEDLADALNGLASEGIPTISIDAFAVVNAVVGDPEEFGFSNVVDPAILFDISDPTAPPVILVPPEDATGYLRWDSIHLTTQFHELFAQVAVQHLIDYYSPSQGAGTPPAQVNGLKGLVRASESQ